MKEDIKTILFIASIALNVVFAATYATYKFSAFANVHQSQMPREPLFLQLDLAPDQLARLQKIRDTFHDRLQELGQEIKTKQIELIDLLETKPPDQQKIQGKQGEIQRLQGEVQTGVISHFLQMSALLKPEQQSRFFHLIKERIGTGVQACPPWMRSPELDRTGGSNNE
jgi:Spy/CpxP family protein refolding chaperone